MRTITLNQHQLLMLNTRRVSSISDCKRDKFLSKEIQKFICDFLKTVTIGFWFTIHQKQINFVKQLDFGIAIHKSCPLLPQVIFHLPQALDFQPPMCSKRTQQPGNPQDIFQTLQSPLNLILCDFRNDLVVDDTMNFTKVNSYFWAQKNLRLSSNSQ